MDIETERKVKFWLWTATKVLVIGYFIIKVAMLLLEKTGLLGTSDLREIAKVKTAKLEIEDNVFSWDEDYRKAVLRIKNYSTVEGQNVVANAYAHYGKRIDMIDFSKGMFISPNSIVTLESNLKGLPLGKIPDSITLCLVHESENTAIRTWSQFRLKGVNSVLTKPWLGQITYKSVLLQKENFDEEKPECLKEPQNFILTKQVTRTKRMDSLELLKQIKYDAKQFLEGLNRNDISKVKQYASKNLFKHLNGKEKNFEYGFNTSTTVLSHDNNVAYINVLLTSQGWSNRFSKDYIYKMQNINKTTNSFYDFLAADDNTYTGKLRKEGKVWKFVIHEKSPHGGK